MSTRSEDVGGSRSGQVVRYRRYVVSVQGRVEVAGKETKSGRQA
jgi:hypothetical protein